MSSTRIIRQLALTLCLLCAGSLLAQRGGGGGGMVGATPGSNFDRGSRPQTIRTPTQHTGPQLGPPGRWWDDNRTAKSLNLRSEQKQRMDGIFESNKGQLLNLYGNLQREESRLSGMSREDMQDENKVFAAIDRVASAKSELEKAKAHYQLQVRKELDATQLAALDKLEY